MNTYAVITKFAAGIPNVICTQTSFLPGTKYVFCEFSLGKGLLCGTQGDRLAISTGLSGWHQAL